MISFVRAFDVRAIFSDLKKRQGVFPSSVVQLPPKEQEEIATRLELLESLLERALPLLERSKRIINDQVPGVPHVIEGSLEQLRIDIDEALTKIEHVPA